LLFDFSSYESEDLYYCMRVMGSNDCVDCVNLRDSQFCSNCIEGKKCYGVHFSQMVEGCRDSFYLYDCRGCNDCILCARLEHKQYCILNKQYSKEEYLRMKKLFFNKMCEDSESLEISFDNLKKNVLHRALWNLNSENVTGDFVNDSKNIDNGFYASECEDCSNIYDCSKNKDCFDNVANEKSELAFEIDTAYDLYDSKFCSYTVIGSNLVYCDQCINIKNCFGCVGLNKKEFCILNKQYSKVEYEEMIDKIKKHMKDTGEWGRPFPSYLSSFPYNLTVAHANWPLTKDEALDRGYMWHDEEDEIFEEDEYFLPEDSQEIDQSICGKTLTCEVSGKKYRIMPKEFYFYKKI
jgi:hypothetical protein